MYNTMDALNVRSSEEILQNNIKELQEQLNQAHTRIHKLHDVIEEMKALSQSSTDNLIKSIDISNSRWENEDEKRHRDGCS